MPEDAPLSDGIARDVNALETLCITADELEEHRKDPLKFLQKQLQMLNEPPKEAGQIAPLLPALA